MKFLNRNELVNDLQRDKLKETLNLAQLSRKKDLIVDAVRKIKKLRPTTMSARIKVVFHLFFAGGSSNPEPLKILPHR